MAMPMRAAKVPSVSVLEFTLMAGKNGMALEPWSLVALICASTPPTNQAI